MSAATFQADWAAFQARASDLPKELLFCWHRLELPHEGSGGRHPRGVGCCWVPHGLGGLSRSIEDYNLNAPRAQAPNRAAK